MEHATQLTTTSPRAAQRARDIRKRIRRKENVEAMRATVAALERAVPLMLTLEDDDAEWDGFLDPETSRVRRLMVQSLTLTKEARFLQSTQYRLKALLREHQVASRVLAGIPGTQPQDEWEASVLRWRMLTHQHFQPWRKDDCDAEVEVVLKEINALFWSTDTQTTGMSFLGWRDRRRVDPLRHAMLFRLEKDFHGFPMNELAASLYRAYTNADLYKRTIVDERVRSSVDVLQKVSPTMCIIRCDEQYPTTTIDAHMLYLLCLIKSEQTITLCVRSIYVPDVQKAIDGPRDVWATNSIWMRWKAHDESKQNYRMSVGGSIAGNDRNYANHWMVEILASVVRTETKIMRRSLLMNS